VRYCGRPDVRCQDTAIAQQEDLTMFGRLVFFLCCNNLAAMSTLPKALDMIGRQYSVNMKTLALYLISKPGPHKVGLSRYRYSLHLIVSQNINGRSKSITPRNGLYA
jgi:hypothetical protein